MRTVEDQILYDERARYRLSRYSYITRTDGGLVLRSPLTGVQVRLAHPWTLRILATLAEPIAGSELVATQPTESQEALASFLSHCLHYGFITVVNEDGGTDEAKALGHWEFHDLLFHAESRAGRQHQPIGATYRFGEHDAESTNLGSQHIAVVALPPADLDWLTQNDIRLTAALETRRSKRTWNSLSLKELGEFLYRACRVTRSISSVGGAETFRVYPSGGNRHPLETYLVIRTASGLQPGLYRYDPWSHRLLLLREMGEDVESLLTDAEIATGTPSMKATVLVVITARFRKTSWKYESIAYHLILVEVGALIQTMYLVATAMGLNACAIGCGDSDRFARLIRSSYYSETSVGEFLLGGAERTLGHL